MFSRMAVTDPAVIGLHGVGPQVDGKLGLDPQQVAPLHGPVVGEFPPRKQPVDQQAPLVRIASWRNCWASGRGQGPDDVQVHPAEKYSIGTEVGRLDAQTLKLAEDQLVDFALRRRGRAAFEGLQRGRIRVAGRQGRGQNQRNDRSR